MNGTLHTAIGAASGFIVANSLQSDPMTTLLLVGLGGISGLMPDIDIDGKLSNKITLSAGMIRTVAQFVGILMMVYSYFEGMDKEKWIGIFLGLMMIVASSYLTQRRMLTVTGGGVLAGGIFLQETWLSLLGIYIMIASFIPHRSYTHSIAGILFFAAIASRFEASLGIDGVFMTCMAGYISHLIADMKILPVNKRGVKYFLPFSSKEF
ncbi:metal-dependent hydrolase [Mesobacillus foraminis]|uniref:metal-dependent hydrolase n=1 Tax=Mesobacillus foraminis TaxID=279826 RepID=UPI000EF51600|nr:metal-dependent hydrolase [Mesobacillus foraminis]